MAWFPGHGVWACDNGHISEQDPPHYECGATNGAGACVVAAGDHAPASNDPGGPVYHETADGRGWIAPAGQDQWLAS